MPFHAFFGIATMTMTSVLGGTFYRSLRLPWLTSLGDDQHLGGAIAWGGSSELPVIVVVIALVVQWARQDRRTAARTDRHADAHYDDDLDAYNAMLQELAKKPALTHSIGSSPKIVVRNIIRPESSAY